MELFNCSGDFPKLTLIKDELKSEPDVVENTQFKIESDLSVKLHNIKEEIDLNWDENDNVYDQNNKLLNKEGDEASTLDCNNVAELDKNEFLQIEQESRIENSKAGKIIQKNRTGGKCLFDRFCKKCQKKSENSSNVCRTCHTPVIFECQICHKYCNSLRGIGKHLSTVCNIQAYYQCISCDYRSQFQFAVARHVKQIHPSNGSKCENKIRWKKICHEKGKIGMYKCSKCEKEFGNYNTLSAHSQYCSKSVNDKHMENKDTITGDLSCRFDNTGTENNKNKNSVRRMTVFYCTKCKKDMEINDFNTTVHYNCLGCGSNMLFKCVKCKKLYGLYSSIVYHLKRMCNSQNTLQCSECDYTAPLVALINKHYRMTHNRQISYCSTCGGQYKNPESLRKHLYNCTRTFYYNCNDCHYRTKIKLNLTHHIAVLHSEKTEIYSLE